MKKEKDDGFYILLELVQAAITNNRVADFNDCMGTLTYLLNNYKLPYYEKLMLYVLQNNIKRI